MNILQGTEGKRRKGDSNKKRDSLSFVIDNDDKHNRNTS